MRNQYVIVNEEQPWEELVPQLIMFTISPTTEDLVKYIAKNDFREGDMVVTACV